MICPDCRTAGRTLREAIDKQDDVMYDNVAYLHSKCPEVKRQYVLDVDRSHAVSYISHVLTQGSQWCDCHHQVEGVNWEQLRLSNAESVHL